MTGPLIQVGDLSDPRLADYANLTDVALRRRLDVERGLFLAESATVIRRALDAGHRPRSMLLSPRWLAELAELVDRVRQEGAAVFVGEPAVLEEVTGFVVHRGAIAAMHRPAPASAEALLASAQRVVILEDIVDHTNVGAIFRSAAGMGADAVLVTPRCADPLYRRSVRVSMGTVFQVPWARLDDWPAGLECLHEAGFTVAALALTPTAVSLDDLVADLDQRPDQRLALVLGTEGTGLSSKLLALADLHVRIPMAGGVDSLNVAAAAAVALWAVRRPQRGRINTSQSANSTTSSSSPSSS